MRMTIILGAMLGTLSLLITVAIIKANAQLRSSLEHFKDAARASKKRRATYSSDFLPPIVRQYIEKVCASRVNCETSSFAAINVKGKLFAGAINAPMGFSAIDYFLLDRPYSVRLATWWFLPFAWLKILEIYQDAKASIHSRLFSSVTVKYGVGKDVDASLLLRYLTHALCFPSVLMNSSYITWREIDANKAKATLTDAGNTVSAIFYFNEEGLVEKIISHDKYRGAHTEEWEVRCFEYEERNGVLMPTKYMFDWNTPQGKVCYASYRVKGVWYDVQPTDREVVSAMS